MRSTPLLQPLLNALFLFLHFTLYTIVKNQLFYLFAFFFHLPFVDPSFLPLLHLSPVVVFLLLVHGVRVLQEQMDIHEHFVLAIGQFFVGHDSSVVGLFIGRVLSDGIVSGLY